MNWTKDFTRLSETKETTVLPLITNCTMQKNEKGDKKLIIDISSDPYVVPIREKIKALNIPRPNLYGKLKVAGRLTKSITDLASCDEPLVMGGGGVLPILIDNDGDKHILCFGRDIIPKGYNAACGLPNSFEEAINPEAVIWREFSEELLIVDSKECAYNFINANLPDLRYDQYIKQHAQLWKLKPRIKNVYISKYPLFNKWEAEINYNGNSVKFNAVWTISPKTGLINFIKPMRIHMGNDYIQDLSVYDCELNPDNPAKSLNRPVAAFNMDKIKNAYDYGAPTVVYKRNRNKRKSAYDHGAPEVVWWSGQNITRMPLLHVTYDPIAAIRGEI